MADTVSPDEVKAIREHYDKYMSSNKWQKDSDNRGAPISNIYDENTFREVSTYYVDRLLRYIEVQEMIDSLKNE